MALGCDCGYNDYDWYYSISDDWYSACSSGPCYGCGQRDKVKTGDLVRRIYGFEMDEDGNEENWRVLGRVCEECADLYDSLTELGFCLSADVGFIGEAIKEYRSEFVGSSLWR